MRTILVLMMGIILFSTPGVFHPVPVSANEAEESIQGEVTDQVPERNQRNHQVMAIYQLVNRLELTEEQAYRLFPMMRELDSKRKELRQSLRNLLKDMRTSLREENGDKDYSSLMKEIRELNSEISDLDEKFLEETAEFLSDRQQAQLFLFLFSQSRKEKGDARRRSRKFGEERGKFRLEPPISNRGF